MRFNMYTTISIKRTRQSFDFGLALQKLRRSLNYVSGNEDTLLRALEFAIGIVEDRTGFAFCDTDVVVEYSIIVTEKSYALPIKNAKSLTKVVLYFEDGTEQIIPTENCYIIGDILPQICFVPSFIFPMIKQDKSMKVEYVAGFSNNFNDFPATIQEKLIALASYMFTYRLNIEQYTKVVAKLFGEVYG